MFKNDISKKLNKERIIKRRISYIWKGEWVVERWTI